MRKMRKSSVLLTIITAGFAGLVSAGSEPESTPATAPASTPTPAPVIKKICRENSEREIWAAFDRWNRSLQTGDPAKVVANYAKNSVLLSTVSNMPRITVAEKEDYFQHFMEKKPVGKIEFRIIEFGCNTAVDAGIYTFTFTTTGERVRARFTFSYDWDGTQWLITSHHSSAMPEKD